MEFLEFGVSNLQKKGTFSLYTTKERRLVHRRSWHLFSCLQVGQGNVPFGERISAFGWGETGVEESSSEGFISPLPLFTGHSVKLQFTGFSIKNRLQKSNECRLFPVKRKP